MSTHEGSSKEGAEPEVDLVVQTMREDLIRTGGSVCGIPHRYSHARLSDYDNPEELWEPTRIGAWTFIYGPVGTGKSHLLAALTRYSHASGLRSRYLYVPDWIAKVQAAYGQRGGSWMDSPEGMIHTAASVPFLALDDLGVEKPSESSTVVLTRLINARYEADLRTVISSNFDVESIRARYERVADRINEMASFIPLADKRPERDPDAAE